MASSKDRINHLEADINEKQEMIKTMTQSIQEIKEEITEIRLSLESHKEKYLLQN